MQTPSLITARRVALATVLAVASTHGAAQSGSTPQRVQAEHVLADTQNGGVTVLLDVRTPEEFALGRVPGAVNVPLGDLSRRLSEFTAHKDAEIVVYCEAGMRAGHAVGLMSQAGFNQLRTMDGHMRGWRQSGLPVER